jgi:hypothetical protein
MGVSGQRHAPASKQLNLFTFFSKIYYITYIIDRIKICKFYMKQFVVRLIFNKIQR